MKLSKFEKLQNSSINKINNLIEYLQDALDDIESLEPINDDVVELVDNWYGDTDDYEYSLKDWNEELE